jgi:peptidoglycan hydrolase CwlO-like protein
MELITLIITSLSSILVTWFLSLLFYKPKKKQAYEEAKLTELNNVVLLQDIYQQIVVDLKKEVKDLQEKYDNLEKKINNMCSECPYKIIFNEKNK